MIFSISWPHYFALYFRAADGRSRRGGDVADSLILTSAMTHDILWRRVGRAPLYSRASAQAPPYMLTEKPLRRLIMPTPLHDRIIGHGCGWLRDDSHLAVTDSSSVAARDIRAD